MMNLRFEETVEPMRRDHPWGQADLVAWRGQTTGELNFEWQPAVVSEAYSAHKCISKPQTAVFKSSNLNIIQCIQVWSHSCNIKLILIISIQWNPINTVTNGPLKFGCVNMRPY